MGGPDSPALRTGSDGLKIFVGTQLSPFCLTTFILFWTFSLYSHAIECIHMCICIYKRSMLGNLITRSFLCFVMSYWFAMLTCHACLISV